MQNKIKYENDVDVSTLKIVRKLDNKPAITGKTYAGEHFHAYNDFGNGYVFTGFGDNIFSRELIEYTVGGVFQVFTARADLILQDWFSKQKDIPDFTDVEPFVSEIAYDASDYRYGRLFIECVVNDFTQLKYEINRDTFDLIDEYEQMTLEGIAYLRSHEVDFEEVLREQAIFKCIEARIREFIKENPFSI